MTPPICFLEGTQITTPSGTSAVELLSIGDDVLLPNGNIYKVKFLGKQSFDLAQSPEAHPVTFDAGSLGVNMPNSPLHVSRAHLVWNGSALTSAFEHINGTTIKPMDNPPSIINYYHVELEEYSIVIANGAWCESYSGGLRDEFHYTTKINGENLALA